MYQGLANARSPLTCGVAVQALAGNGVGHDTVAVCNNAIDERRSD